MVKKVYFCKLKTTLLATVVNIMVVSCVGFCGTTFKIMCIALCSVILSIKVDLLSIVNWL